MGTKETRMQATKEKYLAVLKEYLDNEDYYDIVKYGKGHDCMGTANIAKWVVFAKENLSDEDYERFMEKALPLEPKADGSDKKEKEALKQNMIAMSTKVFQKKAGLMEIYDEITPRIAKYVYMVKQLRFNYKEIQAHVFNKNLEYCQGIDRYDNPNVLYSARVLSISDEQHNMLEKMVTDRGMPLNDITYMEAYKYAVRNGIIQLNQSKSR